MIEVYNSMSGLYCKGARTMLESDRLHLRFKKVGTSDRKIARTADSKHSMF